MRTATFTLPPRALRADLVKLFIHPRGEFPLEARAFVTAEIE